MLIDAAQSCLLVIDVQERLCPVMADPRQVIRNCARLMRGAALLDVPCLVTEQYPKGVGPTVADLRPLIPDGALLEKTAFSAAREPAVLAAVQALDKPRLVVAGIESHVCVLQTALGFAAQGFAVAVVSDACSSRDITDQQTAYDRLRAAGVSLVSTEMVLFEWLGNANHPQFRTVHQTLIR